MLNKGSRFIFRDETGQYSQVGLSESHGGRLVHLVVTVDGDGTMQVYEDGAYRGPMSPQSTAMTVTKIGGQ